MKSPLDRLIPNRWPVKWRIAAVSAGLTFLILLGFAFVVGRLAVDKLEANFHEEAQSSASAVANQLEITFSEFGDRGVTARGLELERLALPSGSLVQLVDSNGEPAFPARPNELELGPPPGEPIDIDDVTVASQVIPTQTFGPSIYVQYARNRASLQSTTDRIWFLLGAGVLAGAALAALAGLAVAGRAMRPIASLTAAAREVATTRDPSHRLPMPKTDDEVAELARTLDDMLRQLDAARSETELMVQAQREFVADASHELRTPLTSIHANLELLQARLADRVGADGEDEEIVAGALGSSKRMRRLVSDLLLLARADAGRAGARGSYDLAEIAEAAIAEVRMVADGHVISLAAPHDVSVSCNPDDLHRLFGNLVENAVRHTPGDTEVRVSVRSEGEEAVIEVADNGPGLPDGLGEQIFARFVRGGGPADLSADAGTGLGLAIVKAVAVSHGGRVEAGASPEGGARLTVRLPLAERQETPGTGSGDGLANGDRAAGAGADKRPANL